jgi:DNA helicase-2/ATP-dependent DNA helicase PcrA
MMAPEARLRPEQARLVFEYDQGQVGVAAVPGSGKTFTLAHLAARLVADQRVGMDQEVLVVTFTNTAVNSFKARISRILEQQYRLLPYIGYRVRTLHGLAHDIVRERPALLGLADDFVILDEKLALDIQRDIVAQRLSEWWERLLSYVDSNQELNPKAVRYQLEQDLPGLVVSFIKRAKDLRMEPSTLQQALQGTDSRFDLARFAVHVYSDYQRSLSYRGAVDFDDLVGFALRALELDEQYLLRLRERWPYILEDEAQDSSWLQEQMLRLLSDNGNWVRVGDPNQAINTTFTTASTRYLLDFLDTGKNPGVLERPLSVSGRSAPSIIRLANQLAGWAVAEHPNPDLRDAFDFHADGYRGFIRATESDDPQSNPSDAECTIHIEFQPGQRINPDQELEMVAAGEEYSLLEWLGEVSERETELPTVAVLVPENSRGYKLTGLLRRYGIPYEELLRSTTATREAVATLCVILELLAEPTSVKALKQAFWTLMAEATQELIRADSDLRQTITKVFSAHRGVEDFLWPSIGGTSPSFEALVGDYVWLVENLTVFSGMVKRWLEAAILPIDQLVLTVGQDVFSEPIDIALVYKIAVLLRDLSQSHPDWRLPQFVDELRVISQNERRFVGFNDEGVGYEPTPGVVTVATMHAAKGLEWDRVYLMAVSNYGFPSALPQDSYIGERWYVRGNFDLEIEHLNLEAEVLDQLEALAGDGVDSYDEGQATLAARLDYARERLRLLYVGVTRAKRELVVTWNMGRFWRKGREYENQPALPLVMLADFVQHGFVSEDVT